MKTTALPLDCEMGRLLRESREIREADGSLVLKRCPREREVFCKV